MRLSLLPSSLRVQDGDTPTPTLQSLFNSSFFPSSLLNNRVSPRVILCGYSIPHPSEARVNIRVQTTGDPAVEVLKDACHDLMLMCEHTRSTFDQALAKFKSEKGMKAMKLGKK
ncbi:hypothetical protein DM860_000088 [Cuscuta australis]|uniref:DNA-directed RNA polymerase RBP11-like dimerisation domain-containing protein n=1 Tax=Cuscuta australis TaxID=267555 RepID=A0A328CW51_9ASTE|nr:hypothetical protein DM860_000088 [Cuscuta australis]